MSLWRLVRPALSGLISVLVGVALVPIAILLVQLWRTTAPFNPMQRPNATEFKQPVQGPSALEIVLSSPDNVEVNPGSENDFHLAIDATESLPPRSIVVVSGLPHGASFSTSFRARFEGLTRSRADRWHGELSTPQSADYPFDATDRCESRTSQLNKTGMLTALD